MANLSTLLEFSSKSANVRKSSGCPLGERGKAAVVREGTDFTLVAYGKMVHVALEAAEMLEANGRTSDVIDLRTLRPLDMETVVESVRKTNRAIVVEEAWKTGGFAGELVSGIQEAAFDSLDGPVGRVGGADVPAPYNGRLEAAAYPDAGKIIDTIERLFGI